MTYIVSGETLNTTHSLSHSLTYFMLVAWIGPQSSNLLNVVPVCSWLGEWTTPGMQPLSQVNSACHFFMGRCNTY